MHTRLPIRYTDALRRLLVLVAAFAGVVHGGFAQAPGGAQDDERLIVMPNPVLFRCTPVGEADTAVITVTNPPNNRRPVLIRNYEVNSPHFKVPRTMNVTLMPGESRRDTLIFIPQFPSQPPFNHRARVRIKQNAGDTDFDVEGRGTESHLIIRRDTLYFDMNGPGDVQERCFVFGNPSCRPIVIVGLDVPPPFQVVLPVGLPDTVRGDTRSTICIRYTAGPLAAKGLLKIQAADGSISTVPLEARAGQVSNIVVNPRPLVFNGVPANSTSAPISVGVENIGTGPDRLTSWDISGPDSNSFSIAAITVPDPLLPGGPQSATFEVRFSPADSGLHTAVITFHLANAPYAATVDVSGNAISEVIRISPRDIDVGETIAGDTITRADTLVLRNIGPSAVDVAGIDLSGADRSYFSVIDHGSATIPPGGGELKYDIRFTPDTIRDFEADALIRLKNGGRLPIKIRGRGVALAPEVRLVWIDSTTSDVPVNQRFRLAVHTAPALSAADDISRFRLVFRVDHRALYPHGTIASGGARDSLYYFGADTVVVERLAGPVILGDRLVDIEFEGLVTGRPRDTVELIDVQFPGHAATITTGNGIVGLQGCDVGTGLGFDKPIAARSAWPVPAVGDVNVSYVAPEGSRPWVRIVDAMGREARRRELPDGSGGVQTVKVTMEGLGSGTYFVELHAGGQMSAVQVIVGR